MRVLANSRAAESVRDRGKNHGESAHARRWGVAEEHDRPRRGVAQRWAPSALVVVVAVITIAPGRLNAVALAVAGVLMVLERTNDAVRRGPVP